VQNIVFVLSVLDASREAEVLCGNAVVALLLMMLLAVVMLVLLMMV
jgi:hypothetical protein